MLTLIADIEANGFLPAVDTIWQISIIDEDKPDVVESYNRDTLDDGIARLAGADRVVMHHGIGYDYPVIDKVKGVKLDIHKLVDTLVLSRLGNPEKTVGHSIEAWGVILGAPKVEHNEWDRWSPAMEVRCNTDVKINLRVWQRLKPMLDIMPVACEIEHAAAIACRDMTDVGITFDEAKARDLLFILMDEKEKYYMEADAFMPTVYRPKDSNSINKVLKNDANRAHWGHGLIQGGVAFSEVKRHKLMPGSRDDIAEYLMTKYNWKPAQRTKGGRPKVDDDILRALPWPEAQVFASYLKVDKLIGYMNGEIKKSGSGGGWLHHVTPEGKLHGKFIPLTAVTGRPSCVAPNLQQVSKDPRARELFVSSPGKVLVGVDADGQELRNLGHYLYPYDGGEYAREVVEGDIHTRVMKMIRFNSRDITKNVEYSMIYGAGNPRLGLYALKDSMDAGKGPIKNLPKRGKEMRQAIMSGITGFEQLLGDVKSAAQNKGRLKGIDGRTLWVRSAHSALNLLLQSAGIIHMKMALNILRPRLADAGFEFGKDWQLLLWVHDEFQLECSPENAEAIGKAAASVIEEAAQLLNFRVPHHGTYQIGNNWKETH
jgi:DNA polymerase-1